MKINTWFGVCVGVGVCIGVSVCVRVSVSVGVSVCVGVSFCDFFKNHYAIYGNSILKIFKIFICYIRHFLFY